jgi:hypothetical protein
VVDTGLEVFGLFPKLHRGPLATSKPDLFIVFQRSKNVFGHRLHEIEPDHLCSFFGGFIMQVMLPWGSSEDKPLGRHV